MISFTEFLENKHIIEEAFDASLYLDKQEEPADLFLGRFNPYHSGHQAIVNMMKNSPVIAIVKGAKSSLDKNKNPLPLNYQKELIKKVSPDIEIVEVPTGYIPDIVNQIRGLGKEVSKLFAGEDRIAGYRGQIDSYNKKEGISGTEKEINVEFVKTPRLTSATTVREAVKNYIAANSKEDAEKYKNEFQDNMPEELWDEIDKIGKYLKDDSSVTESIETSTQSIEITDKPISNVLKRDPKVELSEFSQDKETWENKPEDIEEKPKKIYKKRIIKL